MELLTPLNVFLKGREVSEDTVIKLGIDICCALELCKKRNIIHRDIKPENVFVNSDGDFKLGDFGIARQIEKTQSGLTKTGTLTYMAPEIYRGEKYGSSVDIYSLGIMMYRLLNYNRVPFSPKHPEPINYNDMQNAMDLRMSGVRIPPPQKSDNNDLCSIILNACNFDPKDRLASAQTMREALENIGKSNTPAVVSGVTQKIAPSAETEVKASPPKTATAQKSKTPLPLTAVALCIAGVLAFYFMTLSRDKVNNSEKSSDVVKENIVSSKPKEPYNTAEKAKPDETQPAAVTISKEIPANAPQGTCGKNLKWWIDESSSTLYIVGEGKMNDYDNDAPWKNKTFKNAVVEDGVTSIGYCAFYYCDSLETIHFLGTEEQWNSFGLNEIDISSATVTFGK